VDSGGLVMMIEGLATGSKTSHWLGVWMYGGWQWIGRLLWKTIELCSNTKIDARSGR
jgi:hypothetical protein